MARADLRILPLTRRLYFGLSFQINNQKIKLVVDLCQQGVDLHLPGQEFPAVAVKMLSDHPAYLRRVLLLQFLIPAQFPQKQNRADHEPAVHIDLHPVQKPLFFQECLHGFTGINGSQVLGIELGTDNALGVYIVVIKDGFVDANLLCPGKYLQNKGVVSPFLICSRKT